MDNATARKIIKKFINRKKHKVEKELFKNYRSFFLAQNLWKKKLCASRVLSETEKFEDYVSNLDPEEKILLLPKEQFNAFIRSKIATEIIYYPEISVVCSKVRHAADDKTLALICLKMSL